MLLDNKTTTEVERHLQLGGLKSFDITDLRRRSKIIRTVLDAELAEWRAVGGKRLVTSIVDGRRVTKLVSPVGSGHAMPRRLNDFGREEMDKLFTEGNSAYLVNYALAVQGTPRGEGKSVDEIMAKINRARLALSSE